MSSKQKSVQTTTRNAAGFTQPGLEAASAGLTDAANNAQQYTGRFTPVTSDYTKTGLDLTKGVANSLSPSYGSNALNLGDYTYNKLMSGGYKPATYDPQAAIDAATRPVFEKYGEQVLPSMGAFFTSNGAYQGTAPGGTAAVTGDVLARNLTREVAQAAGEQALAAADLNSRNTLAANQMENQTIGALPGVYQGGVAAAGLPAGAYGAAGALDESIAGRDITEALMGNQYGNTWETSVFGPILQMLTGTGQAFGTDTQTNIQYTNPWTQALSAIAPIASIAMDAMAPGSGAALRAASGATGGGTASVANAFTNPFK